MDGQVVIVGAGHAAGQLLATLRQQGFGGRVTVIGDEPYQPYQRPPLSKKYLSGELPVERLNFKPPAFYEAIDVEFVLETRVDAIDRSAAEVALENGRRLAYDFLFLATGTRVRRLGLPGHDLDGVHYLRSIADADALRADLDGANRLAVVGAGYIGLEVAAVAQSQGVDVTVFEMADRVMSRVVSPTISDFYRGEHEAKGVHFEFGAGIEGFGGQARVESVQLNGGQQYQTDAILVGIGVEPNVELASDAGLDTANGIVVDAHCRTSDPRIFAVGDCTSHPSTVYGRQIRLESVQNALDQARIAVVNALGGDETHDAVPWFWSDQYDLKL